MIESYSVGIDLGTTNAVLAYRPVIKGQAQDKNPATEEIRVLPIGQWVAEGVWQERLLFPTYRYHTLPHESHLLQPLPFACQPLEQDFPVIFGEYAVKLGALNRGQGVSSAKSWLSQASRVHRDAKDAFLPWGIGDELAKSIRQVSPLMASASYLHYLHAWWNHCFPDFPLSEQRLVITVPASFDEYARDLTLAAAEIAGLGHAQFLEEPTAAAYAWHEQQIQQKTQGQSKNPGVMCVLDVGGGTTDLSLIDFRNSASPRRLAVGDHLMLGGDNLDAALAQMALMEMNTALEQKIQLSAAQWSQLMLAARDGKERLFGSDTFSEKMASEKMASEKTASEETMTLSLLGRGKSLIAKQRQAVLNVKQVKNQLFDGFLPLLNFDAALDEKIDKRGLVEVGLQFEQDPAITRHVLRFLHQSKENVNSVLLNGGFFQAEGFRERIQTQFQQWARQAWNDQSVEVIQTPDPQTAVAIGAVSYCEARRLQSSHVIGGGAPRWLFLQLADDSQVRRAVCVAQKGMEEGLPFELPRTFQLGVNQNVQFTLYSANTLQRLQKHASEKATEKDENVSLGEIVEIDPAWVPLPPMQVKIEMTEQNIQTPETVAVNLVSEMTQIGALQLQFKSAMPELKLPDTLLEFAGRTGVAGARINKKNLPHQWPQVITAIEDVYGARQQNRSSKADKEAFLQLRKQLETLGPRAQWNITLCRSLADLLLQWRQNRRRTARHESFWLNLLAFVIRPGYGVVGDINRMDYVREVIVSQTAHHEHDVWFAWWTLVRRCSAGLSADFQQMIFTQHETKLKSLMDYLALKTGTKRTKSGGASSLKKGAKPALSKKEQDLKNRAPEAMLRAVASLDHLRGQTWFEYALFKLLKTDSLGVNQQVVAWCCGMVVRRYPQLTGDSDFNPLPASQVAVALEAWLEEDWQACPEVGLAASIAVQVHKNAAIELDEHWRKQVIDRLRQAKLPETWRESITDSQSNTGFNDALAGEGLPHGLSSS